MNERSVGIFLLLLLLIIQLVTAQIQFPDENYERYLAGLGGVRVERGPPVFNPQLYPSPPIYPNYPSPQNQQIYPSQQNQQNYQQQQTDLNYPSQQNQNYPQQQSEQNYPSQQNQQNYPTQQSQQKYPTQQSQQNYPTQQSQQNYPTVQSSQNYPHQQHQSSTSRPNYQTSTPRQNHQTTVPPRQSNERSTHRQTQQTSQQIILNQSIRQIDQNSEQSKISYPTQQSNIPKQVRQKIPSQTRQQSRQIPVQQNRQAQQSSPKNHHSGIPQNQAAKVVAQGFTKLILDLNRVVPVTAPHLAKADNVVYGPVTIAGALSMVLLASIGATFDEIANFLGLSSGFDIHNDPIYVQEQIARVFAKMESTTGLDIGQRVNFATAIFVQQDYPIRPAYREAAELLYHSDIMNLDFKGNPEMSMDVINRWISGRTNGKIPNLIAEPPPPNTKTIIASALYFQAAWEFPFFDGGTQWRPFYVNGRKRPSDRKALMMSNGGEFPYHKDSNLGVEIMGFPYKGRATTMYVIVPIESNKDKLRKLENSLTPVHIDYLINSTQYTEAVVLFPKMKLESTLNLRPALQRLGVNTMFDQYEANMALLPEDISQRLYGAEAPFVSAPVSSASSFQRPPPRQEEEEDRLIFNRFGDSSNCIPVLDRATNVSRCQESPQNVNPIPLSTRAASGIPVLETLNSIREELIKNPSAANPGLYADQVIHKVYIDITESGTEAAAATGISLNRSGDRVTFRVDTPFLFFIYHEETKVILFWGSVKSPTPTIASST